MVPSTSLVIKILLANVFSSNLTVYGNDKKSTETLASILESVPTAVDFCLSHHYFNCFKVEQYLCIHAGMCMTGQHIIKENGSVELVAVVALCPYFPQESQTQWCPHPLQNYYQIPPSLSLPELTNFTCNYYNREGLMCSQCRPGYGPAVYAYGLMCAKCSDSSSGWVLYFVLTLFPITFFYLVIILFNIKITSPPLTSFVFMCQVYTFVERLYVDIDMKVVLMHQSSFGSKDSFLHFLIQTVRTLCGFWSLDFFRSVIPPFCVSSNLTNIQGLLLEFVYVFYPLLLIIITWMCIELHARNFRPLVLIWKPFHKTFVRLQKSWDPTASIVNSFSTFTMLYSAKLLFVSSNLVFPTKFYFTKPSLHFNRSDHRVYFDPSVKLYSKHYWQYFSCSVIFVMVLVVLPTILLCLYPVKLFRRLFHHFVHLKLRLILITFLDTFQGHYKDGTDGTRDYRFMSAVHLLLLGLIVLCRFDIHAVLYFTQPTQAICIVGSLLFAIVRPCKNKYSNITQSVLMALTAFAISTLSPGPSTMSKSGKYITLLIMLMCILMQHIALGGIVVYRIAQRYTNILKAPSKKLKTVMGCVFHRSKHEEVDTFPINNDNNNRGKASHDQRLSLPTERTSLLSIR